MEIFKPPVSFLLKQAAGIKRASMEPGNKVAGIVSIKHVYEIAKFKLQDINCAHLSLKEMCIKIINSANRAGIKVVKEDINPAELKEFLEKRRMIEEAEKQELVEKKAAKAMRASAAAAAASAASSTAKK
jgi:large subunit ribosomal protein L11